MKEYRYIFHSLIWLIVIMFTVRSQSVNKIRWINLDSIVIQTISFGVIQISAEKVLKNILNESGNRV